MTKSKCDVLDCVNNAGGECKIVPHMFQARR